MKLLLDTHVFLWMSLDAPQLSPQARDLLADTDHVLLRSASSYGEIGIKVSLGKYRLDEPREDFVNRELEKNAMQRLPMETRHAAQLASLPCHHRDPFDRMRIAQAMVERVALMSKGVAFDDYGVHRVW